MSQHDVGVKKRRPRGHKSKAEECFYFSKAASLVIHSARKASKIFAVPLFSLAALCFQMRWQISPAPNSKTTLFFVKF